jgi:threonylcarbamoyladenosine tRNA methylthiotransferase MtaB
MLKKNEVLSFGCRLNIYESEIIKNNLAESGLDNVIVLNTCAVTNEAEKEARKAIRKLKRDNPEARIIVTGCAAQINPEKFNLMPEVDKVLGNQEKLKAEYYSFDFNRVVVNDIMSIKETAGHLVSGFDGKARAFIEVQNGCDHRCTFCTIPFGRGNSRSVPIGAITQQIKLLLEQGYREIVFSGVDITGYGKDLPGSPTFAQMIRRVLGAVPDLSRLRLSSIDVAEIDEELFELMAYEKRLMPHFHVSLQSGDNMILKRMKRRHNREQVIDYCERLRNVRPEVAFGADIITGFPTETDEMFDNTKELVKKANLQYLHVFPFSERDNTPAARMPQVDKQIRKARAAELRDIGKGQVQKFFSKNIGSEASLLVENKGLAHSENFIPVRLSKEFAPGILIKARLASGSEGYMIVEEC